MYSVAWMELGNDARADRVSLKELHDMFSQRLPHLGHIPLITVDVVSHLGDIIPVPSVFASTWKVLFISSCISLLMHFCKLGF
jgi:hypothetical protein